VVIGEWPVVGDADRYQHRQRAPHCPVPQRTGKEKDEHACSEDHRAHEPWPHGSQQQGDGGEPQCRIEMRGVGGTQVEGTGLDR
jgi:hypothetical protein